MVDTPTLAAPSAIDLASVNALRDALVEHRSMDLTIDVGAVDKIGGLGVQVLLAAAAAWSLDGRALSIVNGSPAFLETLRLTAATPLLELCR
jgi:chemotaxis protein CheX